MCIIYKIIMEHNHPPEYNPLLHSKRCEVFCVCLCGWGKGQKHAKVKLNKQIADYSSFLSVNENKFKRDRTFIGSSGGL